MGPASELQPPPEGVLIRLARQARGLSPEAAAELTSIQIGGGRWRQIESGYERKSPPKRAYAPDLTLAHMAHAVGVDPDRLEAAGRPEAADILREILRSGSEAQSAGTSGALSSREAEVLADMVASAAEGFGLSEAELQAAFRRAQELIERRRGGLTGRDEGPEEPSRHRAS